MEDQAVIEFFLDQADKVVDGNRSDLRIKLGLDYISVFHGKGYDRILCHNKLLPFFSKFYLYDTIDIRGQNTL